MFCFILKTPHILFITMPFDKIIIIKDDQFGLKLKHFSVHQISKISNYVSDNFSLNKYTRML